MLPARALAGAAGWRLPAARSLRRTLSSSLGHGADLAKASGPASETELQGRVAELTSTVAQLAAKCEGLQAQNAELLSACAGIAKQVQHLEDSIAVKCSKNLLELQAAKCGGSKAAPAPRDHFRPTLDLVANQVNHASQLDNDTLACLAIGGDGFAIRERLLREIMQTDGCSWEEAHDRLIEMDEFNERWYWSQTFPYRLGICGAIAGTVGSCLFVFSKTAAYAYGVNVAGEELPEGVKDIDELTYNQVGAWTWTWMEPMIGTASFVLLCLQFGRAQSIKLKMFPYTEAMLNWRARRLTNKYPQYECAMMRSWAKIMPAVGWDFMPKYRRRFYTPEARYKNFRGGI